MNVEAFREYCMGKKGTTESFPFDGDTLVFKVLGKMYALIALERLPAQANLKCDPERALELRETFDGIVIPGYHMSKVHWNTIMLERLEPRMILELIDHSYDLVVAKLPKYKQEELL